MTTKKLLRGLGVGWLVLVAASCVGTEDPDGEGIVEGSERADGEDIQQALSALPTATVVDTDEGGVPTFVTGRLGKVNSIAGGTPDVMPVLSDVAKVFRASPADLKLRVTISDPESGDHFRFAQTKNGLDVLGGELIIHVKNGLVTGANGKARHDLVTPAKDSAKIDAAAAVTAAKNAMTDVTELTVADGPALAYLPGTSKMELVYVVKATGVDAEGTPLVDDVLVSAADGSVRDRIAHVYTALNREEHNLNHGTSLPGPVARTETQAPVSDAVINTNFDRLGDTYAMYKDLYGRDSFDGTGGKLIASVHYSNNYVNAFWNGTQMVYGDGDGVNASNLANSMDVTAHELTHAVTERTSNLTYSGQSGGLNEGMSDIQGNVAEWYRDVAHDTTQPPSANNFLVGEDVWTPATPGDALRYMCNPSLDGGSIDIASQFTSSLDVHYSSGVPNLAFCLLAKGGTHPKGKTTTVVPAIGMLKAGKVFNTANTTIWTASTNYASAKTGCVQAAVNLGLTAAEQDAVAKAWEAVGVGGTPPPPPGVVVLTNGTAKTGLSGASGSNTFYSLDVTSGATGLKFVLSGGTGDADMFVKFGTQPTTSSYDCRPYLNGNNETCNIATAQVGKYFVMLNGFTAYSGTSLLGSFSTGNPPPTGCSHSPCVTGTKLTSGCEPVVTTVCAADSFCCNSSWDSICVGEAKSAGKTCP